MSNDDQDRDEKKSIEDSIIVVREGHGANCSSIGSIIDTLFVAQVAAGAIFAAVAAALAEPPPTPPPTPTPPPSPSPSSEDS